VLAAFVATPVFAQWVEQGDAGDLPATAQVPVGTGPLTTISGTCTTGDVDMYCINVDDAAAFSAETCNTTSWDTQLFTFDATGVGVKTNDDACGLQSRITDLAACGSAPGQHFIAVSRFNNDPRDANNVAIFSSSNGCSSNANPVVAWTGTTSSSGDYVITFLAVSYCGATAVEPSTWGSIKSLYN
jgi:hypothetical protein